MMSNISSIVNITQHTLTAKTASPDQYHPFDDIDFDVGLFDSIRIKSKLSEQPEFETLYKNGKFYTFVFINGIPLHYATFIMMFMTRCGNMHATSANIYRHSDEIKKLCNKFDVKVIEYQISSLIDKMFKQIKNTEEFRALVNKIEDDVEYSRINCLR